MCNDDTTSISAFRVTNISGVRFSITLCVTSVIALKKGRCLVANRDLKPLETILTEAAAVIAPNVSSSFTVCIVCLKVAICLSSTRDIDCIWRKNVRRFVMNVSIPCVEDSVETQRHTTENAPSLKTFTPRIMLSFLLSGCYYWKMKIQIIGTR